MITIPRESAIALIRDSLAGFSPYFGDPDTVKFREKELLNGCKYWLERDKESNKLIEEDEAFLRKWAYLSECNSLEDVPNEFLQALFEEYNHGLSNLDWLMNAQQV